MNLANLDFALPQALIAQEAVRPRDSSKLLVCQRGSAIFRDKIFRDLPDFLHKGDLLVLNNAKVLPVRLLGVKKGGTGKVEALLLEKLRGDVASGVWRAILKLSARVKPGLELDFGSGLEFKVLSTHEERQAKEGEVEVELRATNGESINEWLEKNGNVPLPPYIQRQAKGNDQGRYQTVYASKEGSAAAPTAGFHFTEELLDKIRAEGVRTEMLTLHVGLGTFRPVKTENLDDHLMHEEVYEISEALVSAIAETKKRGGRVIAVGTTVVRALESSAEDTGAVQAGTNRTRIFIKPGFQFKVIDALVTNFHLPKSTLLALVGAFLGMKEMHAAYAHAIAKQYRFFSYGDAMYISNV